MSPAPFRFPRSIATVSLAGTLPEKLEAAGSVGFDGIELFENDLLTFDGAPAELRRIGRQLGLAITAFQRSPHGPRGKRTRFRCTTSERPSLRAG